MLHSLSLCIAVIILGHGLPFEMTSRIHWLHNPNDNVIRLALSSASLQVYWKADYSSTSGAADNSFKMEIP